MLPLQATSLMAYKRLLYAMMLVNALGLYGRHGRLRFNAEVWYACLLPSVGRRFSRSHV